MVMALTAVALSALVGCGSSKTSNDGFGSSALSSTTSNAVSASMATCSQDVSGLSDLKVRIMQYVDAYGVTHPDYIRLQFVTAPSAWQTSNLDMMIYRWTAAPDNSTSLDSTPLGYQFERKSGAGFQLLGPNVYQYFNWNDIVAQGQYANISATSPQDFFNTATLLVNVKDLTNSYQVLRVVFRQNGNVVESVDVLIPSFLADPAKYDADSRHPVTLQALHPLKDKLGQSWSDTNYAEFARAFCF